MGPRSEIGDKMMKVFDVSWPISPATTGYKDKHAVKFAMVRTFEKDNVRDSIVEVSSHTGTHVDAPSHFLKDGKTIDEIHLDRLMGKCKVLSLTLVDEEITPDDLMKYEIEEGDIILLKTNNSAQSPIDKFNYNYVYLGQAGARYLGEKKIKAVGIDYLSIERSHPDHPTHMTLFHHDILIIEGLRLGHIEAGEYFFVCLPLYSIGLEAAPARAILIQSFGNE